MGMSKYNTEEERKAAKRERNRRYRERHKEEIAVYRAAHKEEKKVYNAVHYQNNKEEILAKQAAYRATHKEERKVYYAAYSAVHKDEIATYMAEYRATPFGRATCLVCGYRKADRKSNRGECTVTPQWIVDNVFSGQCCAYCGESDWHKLGCDRKDSLLPHTPENCVPCCKACNDKKGTTFYDEFMRRIGKIA